MATIYVSPAVEVSFGEIPGIQNYDVSLGNIIMGTNRYPEYNGSYQVTPTQETQVLPTKNTLLEDDIIVDPIPECYGLITWNGSFITVS